jgi:steroid delta-isomerase-like uncharacterized protein
MISYNFPSRDADKFVKNIQMKVLFVASAMLIFSGMITKNKTMQTIQKNKEVVQRLFEQALNKKNLGLLPDLIGPDFTDPPGEKGPAGFRATIEPLIKAFPDIRYELGDMVAEEDKVAVQWTWHGTQTGQFRNTPATGKLVTDDGMAIFTLKEGKITGGAILTDRLGFLQKLGVLPADF